MEVSDGRVTDCLNDSEFLHLTTSNPLVIMHYYHEQYQRCSILDGHLAVRSINPMLLIPGELFVILRRVCVCVYM